MASKYVGMVMKHRDKLVVVVQTGLSTGGADAVMIAQLEKRKPSGDTPFVEVKTFTWGDYRIPLGKDQMNVVKDAEVVYAYTGPSRIPKEPLAAVLKATDKVSE